MVTAVAEQFPEKYIDDRGETKLYSVLHDLGFYIDHADYLKGVRTSDDVIVRDNSMPSRVYHTKIYNGTVRNEVERMNGNKKIIDKFWHYIYDKYEVLQPKDLQKYVSLDKMGSILDIGTIDYYNQGMAKMNQRADNSKVKRNIVR
jgi:hypothetical protein